MVGTRHAIVRFGPASNFRLPPSCGTARGFFPCFQNGGHSNPRRAATLSPQVFFPSMRERLVAAEGLEPQACKSRPGGAKLTRFTLLCSALLCLALLCLLLHAFALWLFDSLVLLLFVFFCFCMLACLFPCLLVSWLAGLLDCLLAWCFLAGSGKGSCETWQLLGRSLVVDSKPTWRGVTF